MKNNKVFSKKLKIIKKLLKLCKRQAFRKVIIPKLKSKAAKLGYLGAVRFKKNRRTRQEDRSGQDQSSSKLMDPSLIDPDKSEDIHGSTS